MALLTLTDLDGTARLNVSDGGIVTCWGITADVTGNLTGNADTATALATTSVFKSSEVTGTGSAQNTAHGLGQTPGLVWFAVSEDPAGAGFDVTEGTHTSTNCVFTVTSGVKYKVYAIK